MRVVRKLANGYLFGEETGTVFGLPRGGWCDQCKTPLLSFRVGSGTVERVCGHCGLRIERVEAGVWKVNHYGYHLGDGSLMCGSHPIELGRSRECGKCGCGYKDYYGEDTI